MPYQTLMYMHYVMEAQDHFREAQRMTSASNKLDGLIAALESLDNARECGAPAETIHEMKLRYYREFFKITEGEHVHPI